MNYSDARQLIHFEMIASCSETIEQENRKTFMGIIIKCEFSDSVICSETKKFMDRARIKGNRK
jgi:hypothetical protein